MPANTDPEMARQVAQFPCPHARPSWQMCPHCLGLNAPLSAADRAQMGTTNQGVTVARWSDYASTDAGQLEYARETAIAKDQRIAELERENALLKAPEKISAKTLYQRLVGKLLGHWAELYPMVEWVDPEQSAAIMAREIAELRKDKARLDWIEARYVGICAAGIGGERPRSWIVDLFDTPYAYQNESLRAAIDAAMKPAGSPDGEPASNS